MGCDVPAPAGDPLLQEDVCPIVFQPEETSPVRRIPFPQWNTKCLRSLFRKPADTGEVVKAFRLYREPILKYLHLLSVELKGTVSSVQALALAARHQVITNAHKIELRGRLL